MESNLNFKSKNFQTCGWHHVVTDKDIAIYVKYLETWLLQYVTTQNLNGVAIGLSGGIDSAVVAVLATRSLGSKKVSCYSLNIANSKLDYECIDAIKEKFDIDVIDFQLDKINDSYIKVLKLDRELSNFDNVAANIKPRVRMIALYTMAQTKRQIVLGTTNYDEYYVGYYTKYGDGASDINLLIGLIKKHIYQIAEYLEIPAIIIDRPPSASLYDNQTDEAELGFSYEVLDKYLSHETIPTTTRIKIEKMHKVNKHKEHEIVGPNFFMSYLNAGVKNRFSIPTILWVTLVWIILSLTILCIGITYTSEYFDLNSKLFSRDFNLGAMGVGLTASMCFVLLAIIIYLTIFISNNLQFKLELQDKLLFRKFRSKMNDENNQKQNNDKNKIKNNDKNQNQNNDKNKIEKTGGNNE